MATETNKSLRIRTNVGGESDKYVNVLLDQDYNSFQILSLTLSEENTYKLHNSNYGVIVGRALANNGFGIPNAKISVFVSADINETDTLINTIYPYSSVGDKNDDGVKYNLLPNKKVNDCHKAVGTFPYKTYLLDNDSYIEVFEKYYKYTTRTNNSGDYMLIGIPTGQTTIHMDLDLSDCGILSQRPRDFVYKGYNIEQFENPNQFKDDDRLESLSQIFTQDISANVIPFWGDTTNNDTIGITRADIEVAFKFEPTCVFMGSVLSDDASNGISRRCVPTNESGSMEKLVTGEGTIEMIRKTQGGSVEEFQIKGTQLINADGIWCYQIPMNLDYMMTDEYGNMVPTDDPSKGIPTRARVRFRVSMQDTESNNDGYFRSKALIPNNPSKSEDYDYNFGSYTNDSSFRDLFWNNVYSVKSYIPRIQKGASWRNDRFTGIKVSNFAGTNNPMPYNNMRVKMPISFVLLCFIIRAYISVLKLVNPAIQAIYQLLISVSDLLKKIKILGWYPFENAANKILSMAQSLSYLTIADGMCEDLESWYFTPTVGKINNDLLQQTLAKQIEVEGEDNVCMTTNTDYLIPCVEMSLAQEYKVIKFDFYNDWLNGAIYLPRWNKTVKYRKNIFTGEISTKTRGCMADTSVFSNSRKYFQQCSMAYAKNNDTTYSRIINGKGCALNGTDKESQQLCHKAKGKNYANIFGENGGLVYEGTTMADQKVYYLKPCEKINGKKVNLFATDIILLGSLNDCDLYGIPQAFEGLTSTSYKMPTNLALTNMDTEGYIYVNGDTICSSSGMIIDSVTRVGNSFSELSKAYSGTDDEITYSGSDDAIPMTEAAGIAWNYSGPGQEDNSFNDLYYPGGHFLRIGCVSSDVNVKSCVNLQRVCEIGSEISSRHEVVAGADGEGNDLYAYLVPTGFVAKDEITDETFRSMFATMNRNRLLADEINDQTGYPIYSFKYSNPNNFDGALRNIIGTSTKYNKKIDIADELSELGLTAVDSYDEGESAYTYNRTMEATSKDYYMFRMGLDSLSETIQEQKFLGTQTIGNNTGYILPQYENSFYFYFGLHNGATALDEFRKQFYSKCGKDDESLVIPNIIFRGYEQTEDLLINGGTVNITIENMSAPYKVLIDNTNTEGYDFSGVTSSDNYSYSGIPIGAYNVIVTDSKNITATLEIDCLSSYIKVNGLSAVDFKEKMGSKNENEILSAVTESIGKYTISGYSGSSFVNGNGILIVGDNLTYQKQNTGGTFDTKPFLSAITSGNAACLLISDGEYYINTINSAVTNVPINITGAEFLGEDTFIDLYRYKDGDTIYESVEDLPEASANTGYGYYVGNDSGDCAFYVSENSEWVKKDNGIYHRIPLWNTHTAYNVYYGELGTQWGWIPLGTFSFIGYDNEDMYMGSTLLPYDKVLKYLRPEWWKYLDSERESGPFNGNFSASCTTDLSERQVIWLLRHFTYKDSDERFNSKIFTLSPDGNIKEDVLIGQPEKDVDDSTIYGTGLYNWNESSSPLKVWTNQSEDNYAGYNLFDNWVDRCTYNIEYPTGLESISVKREQFKKFAFREDGTPLFSGVSINNGNGEISYEEDYYKVYLDNAEESISGASVLKIDVSGEEKYIYVAPFGNDSAKLLNDIQEITDNDLTNNNLSITILEKYSGFEYPVIYKPFTINYNPFVWKSERPHTDSLGSEYSMKLCYISGATEITDAYDNIPIMSNTELNSNIELAFKKLTVNNGNRNKAGNICGDVFSSFTINGEKVEYVVSGLAFTESSITINQFIASESDGKNVGYSCTEGCPEFSGIQKEKLNEYYNFRLSTISEDNSNVNFISNVYYKVSGFSLGDSAVTLVLYADTDGMQTLYNFGKENNTTYYLKQISGVSENAPQKMIYRDNTYVSSATSVAENVTVSSIDNAIFVVSSTSISYGTISYSARTISFSLNGIVEPRKFGEVNQMKTIEDNIVFDIIFTHFEKPIFNGGTSINNMFYSYQMAIIARGVDTAYSQEYQYNMTNYAIDEIVSGMMRMSKAEFEDVANNGTSSQYYGKFMTFLNSFISPFYWDCKYEGGGRIYKVSKDNDYRLISLNYPTNNIELYGDSGEYFSPSWISGACEIDSTSAVIVPINDFRTYAVDYSGSTYASISSLTPYNKVQYALNIIGKVNDNKNSYPIVNYNEIDPYLTHIVHIFPYHDGNQNLIIEPTIDDNNEVDGFTILYRISLSPLNNIVLETNENYLNMGGIYFSGEKNRLYIKESRVKTPNLIDIPYYNIYKSFSGENSEYFTEAQYEYSQIIGPNGNEVDDICINTSLQNETTYTVNSEKLYENISGTSLSYAHIRSVYTFGEAMPLTDFQTYLSTLKFANIRALNENAPICDLANHPTEGIAQLLYTTNIGANNIQSGSAYGGDFTLYVAIYNSDNELIAGASASTETGSKICSGIPALFSDTFEGTSGTVLSCKYWVNDYETGEEWLNFTTTNDEYPMIQYTEVGESEPTIREATLNELGLGVSASRDNGEAYFVYRGHRETTTEIGEAYTFVDQNPKVIFSRGISSPKMPGVEITIQFNWGIIED